MKKQNQCPVCNNASSTFRHSVQEYKYFSCNDCGSTFIEPFPTEDESHNWYQSEEYYQNNDHNVGYGDYEKMKKGLQKTFMQRIKLMNLNNKNKRIKILEVGCALGYCAEILESIPDIDYTGIDLNSYAITEMREKGFKAINGSIIDVPENESYDAIIFFDVLEHIISPSNFFQEVKSKLFPDGVILFCTPSTDSILSKISGNKWISYIVPQHVLLYNKKSIYYLLKKNGFRVKKIKNDNQWVTLDFLIERLSNLFSPFIIFRSIAGLINRFFSILIPVPNGNVVILAELDN